MAARGETQANVEVSTLVVPAWRLRWRAPELAQVLGERALALASARHDEPERLRAEAVVVFAANRVDRGVRIADRAIDALKAAEAAGEHETAWLLRVELAACARSVGAPLTGFAAVTPVLEAPDVPAELRASALVQASECLVTVGRGDEPTRALAEADQLYVADTTLDDDTRLLLRGLIRAVQAAQHRRWGDIAAAIGAAREGLDLLGRFTDPEADSGQGLGRLTLELVLALMDANRLLDAGEAATPMLERPVRAPSASTTGWLRLALATRVHLPAGRVAVAREMLREAVASAERHQLDTLLAESLLALAHVHEVSGELADALTNLRSAHAAERRRARAVYAVRARLAAEFSGVHRQPADLHQQLASLLRPVEGVQMVTDGVLSAALKQQLRQWRPVQVRKGDGLKVNRVRRAAEDMTVDGLSAARQHAADRWRMVQPFGEPDDKTPDPVEQPAQPSSDRTVPASGLIASAGAMVSGRRRAARVAAGEIDDDQPTTTPAEPPAAAPEPQLTADQERKRKVEQQLMELQREARRQIEEERQARADQRAKAEREAAEEAARQAAAREEAARKEAAREEAARKEAARKEAARQAAAREEAARQEAASQEAAREAATRLEVARQEAARQEAARQEAAWQETAREAAAREEAAREAAREEAARAQSAAREEASRAQPESVMDMLKAQGLRAGGRRRAPDAESQSETPSWRVEPPARLREDDPTLAASSQAFAAGAHSAPDAPATPDSPSHSGLAAAFSRPPAAPDFGPHLDDQAPAYPLHTPAGGFPASPADEDERKLPEHDYTNLAFTTQSWARSSVPSPDPAQQPDPTPTPDPERKPLPPLPDPIPQVPIPDEIPQPAEPDLLSSTFLSPADVEPDDDVSTLPTAPVRVTPEPDQSSSTTPGPGAEPGHGTQPAFGTQPTFGTQAGFGTQPNFGAQPTFGTQADFGTQPDRATEPSEPDQGSQPDPAAWANFDFGPDFEADSNVVMLTGPATHPGSAAQQDDPITPPDTGFGAATPADFAPGAGFGSNVPEGPAAGAGFGSATQPDSPPQYDFFAAESESVDTDPFSIPETGLGDATRNETAVPTPPSAEPVTEPVAETKSEPGTRTGRPSSRRKPSDLSLADLLAEALVAYETGRRSDEEQLEATDMAAPEWSTTDAARSDPANQSYLPERQAEPELPPSGDSPFGSQAGAEGAEGASGADPVFSPGSSFGSPVGADDRSGADSDFRPGSSFGPPPGSAGEDEPGTDIIFRPGLPFGSQQPPSDSFGSGQFGSPHTSAAADASPGADSAFLPGSSFGTQSGPANPAAEAPPGGDPLFQPDQHSASYFLPEQSYRPEPSADPAPVHPGQEPSFLPGHPFGADQPDTRQESEQEKTGPIVPVATTADNETTGPIRPVRPDGPAGWTLPGT